jgi:hypothetical protein
MPARERFAYTLTPSGVAYACAIPRNEECEMETNENTTTLDLLDLGDVCVETKQASPFHDIKDTAFTWTWWAVNNDG